MYSGLNNTNLSIKEKFLSLSFFYILLISIVAITGIAMLYSAANGNWNVWAMRHAIRFAASFVLMFVLIFIDIKIFLRYAYLFYFASLILLITVEVAGHTGMGATRWLDLGPIRVQPSELMKIALVLALARYFHTSSMQTIESIKGIIPPIAMGAVPALLVMVQPDLGTGLTLMLTTGIILFVVGVQIWKFVAVGVLAIVALPIGWVFLHDYQKLRVLTFLDPERDPLGAGYHIMQSKIALGSGGIWGKGFLSGTQSHLNFLPEKHTDFIFTMFSEEFGIIGACLLLLINLIILAYSFSFAMKTTSYFGKLVIIGISSNYFLYVFINIAMVLGLLPVVGVPLPLISYGGTVMISVMAGFGIILSMYVTRSINLGKE